MEPPRLSVCLVNWNTRDLLARCLETLAEYPPNCSYEVLVVDNASADGSAALVAERFPDVRLFANNANLGYAAGNNQALSAARGELLLLLNPDIEILPEALAKLVDFMDAHPRAGASAPQLVNPDGSPQPSFRRFPTPSAVLAGLLESAGFHVKRPYKFSVKPEAGPVQVEQPMASATLLRRVALDEVGLFDEGFPLFFNDVDLCLRLVQAGWEIWAVPASRLIHQGGASTRQVRVEAVRASHRSLLRFYRKHYYGQVPALAYWSVVLAAHLGGGIRILLARLSNRRTGNAR